jgi:hypothetical protein
MPSCLIQQLYRQKVGIELDHHLVDEILFPMLRSRRHPSKELLQDIKMTQSCNDQGHSAIVQIFYGGVIRNSSLFGVSSLMAAARRLRRGKNTSKFRRHTTYRTSWGSVDILNEIRESKTRSIIYEYLGEECDGMSICLEEEPQAAARSPALVPNPKLEVELFNEFIEQSLLPGKRLSWGGSPNGLFEPILSTCY